MDEIDKKIIELLQENSRISITDIAKIINLSRPSVSERIEKLIEKGVLEKFTTYVPAHKVGHEVSFFMEISNIKISFDKLVNILLSNEYITEIHCVTGNTNYIVRASMPNIEMMNQLLSELMKYSHVVTSIVLHSPLAHRPIKPL
ncbi:Lrp/AsnC family transcriptional regulator [Clostridium aciditolerans]|uniref:Lrp/AsnC family transcriptional regulator n=1 Tax=Clostridium aciditolerans TaxID=339861 RepID=A0A934I5H0_9CLOT|nr:Lrp/AsnC family transcriptional regulator [Clostridium aciditolerans]MBI6875336.1 Lrp/AsnC family transcriptional regulator [Clostridium aciditolerans]